MWQRSYACQRHLRIFIPAMAILTTALTQASKPVDVNPLNAARSLVEEVQIQEEEENEQSKDLVKDEADAAPLQEVREQANLLRAHVVQVVQVESAAVEAVTPAEDGARRGPSSKKDMELKQDDVTSDQELKEKLQAATLPMSSKEPPTLLPWAFRADDRSDHPISSLRRFFVATSLLVVLVVSFKTGLGVGAKILTNLTSIDVSKNSQRSSHWRQSPEEIMAEVYKQSQGRLTAIPQQAQEDGEKVNSATHWNMSCVSKSRS